MANRIGPSTKELLDQTEEHYEAKIMDATHAETKLLLKKRKYEVCLNILSMNGHAGYVRSDRVEVRR